MVSINTNLSSIIVQGNLTKSTNALNLAIERMTTGAKLNHAKDNAAGYSIAQDMSSKLSGYGVAEDNISMGLDMVSTASSSLELISNMTTRLRALAEQSLNGTYSKESRKAIKSEAKALAKEIARITNETEYNGITLFYTEPTYTALSEIDADSELTEGVYKISTAEELAKLATMTNNGKIGSNTTFVLGADIDLSGYTENGGWTPIGDSWDNPFTANFDGNGHTISNLYIDRSDSIFQGLFGFIDHLNADSIGNHYIKNLNIQNVNIKGYDSVGALSGRCRSNISNVKVSGTVEASLNSCGGLTGIASTGSVIDNCVSSCDVTVRGPFNSGGLVGATFDGVVTITNCHTTGNVKGHGVAGGIVGCVYSKTYIYDSYSTGDVNGGGVSGVANDRNNNLIISNCYCTGIIKAGNTIIDDPYAREVEPDEDDDDDEELPDEEAKLPRIVTLQVGIDGEESSQISFDSTFFLNGLNAIINAGLHKSSSLIKIDEFLERINDIQTKLGAVENRLYSALDSVGVSIQNLTSSRSTIKDADIAKVSSEYIRHQILQQAGATLLATANQSPSIALQLL